MITLTPDARANAPLNGRANAVADHYYSLVHWLRAVGESSGVAPKSIGLTSCANGAGVSTVASNLAVAAAQIFEEPVLLLDLSGRGPASRCSALHALGGGGMLEADVSPVDCARPSTVQNLSLLVAVAPGGLHAPGVDTHRIDELLRSLEGAFGFIVVDLPAVESSMCFVSAGLLNGVLLVMELERTHAETAVRAKQRLLDARASVLGVILNQCPQHLPGWLQTSS